jgi:hypothetical protein
MGWKSLILAALLMVGPALAAEADSGCEMTACRPGGFKLAVFFDRDHYTGISVTHSPYVLPDGAILIFPGETLVFELPLDGEKIGRPKFLGAYQPKYPMMSDPDAPLPPSPNLEKLDPAKLPPNTLVLSYGQTGGRAQGDPMMMLTLSDNLPMTLKLDAIMTVIRPHTTAYEQVPTSTCPLMPKAFGMESWPNALGPMILRNIRVLPAGAPMGCN